MVNTRFTMGRVASDKSKLSAEESKERQQARMCRARAIQKIEKDAKEDGSESALKKAREQKAQLLKLSPAYQVCNGQ